MAGVNKVILVGNLGRDPEVRYTPSGDAVCNLSLATSEQWKDKSTGEKKERTEWHRVTCFKRQAEVIGEYAKKGSKLYVEGSLNTREWEKDGQKHYTTEVKIRDFQFLDPPNTTSQEPSSEPSNGGFEPPPADDFDNDIPF